MTMATRIGRLSACCVDKVSGRREIRGVLGVLNNEVVIDQYWIRSDNRCGPCQLSESVLSDSVSA